MTSDTTLGEKTRLKREKKTKSQGNHRELPPPNLFSADPLLPGGPGKTEIRSQSSEAKSLSEGKRN